MLAIKRFGLSSGGNEGLDLDQYLALVNDIVIIIETHVERGTLGLYQDLSSSSTSVLCVFLKKVGFA